MYAIVEIAGKQFKVAEKQKLFVPLLQSESGDKVAFENIMLFQTDNDVKVGSPFISGMKVEATVLQNIKDEKVLVFKKKRRKSYRRTRGHRQQYTQIEINKIS